MIVTHDHDVASQCKRIINLKDGRLVGDQVVA
jgi:predicted ABC-type transport system involved in lysophospholipase L1 biosynthesis ATPase subunit